MMFPPFVGWYALIGAPGMDVMVKPVADVTSVYKEGINNRTRPAFLQQYWKDWSNTVR